ncbi:hypothetical protein LGN11_27480 [Burkholderia multivorans]|nr:hypothetical protein [Burkholderia multivorans]
MAEQNNALNNDLQHVDKVVQLIDKLRARNSTIAAKCTSDDLLKTAENVYGGNGGPNGMRVWNSLADAQAGTAARGTTFYQDAQGQYVEQWKVPAGAEDIARSIVDNAKFYNGPSYANVTTDNLGQLMSTYQRPPLPPTGLRHHRNCRNRGWGTDRDFVENAKYASRVSLAYRSTDRWI